MDRRGFLKSSSLGLAGLTLGGQSLPWMIKDAVAAAAQSGEVWKFGVMADTQWSNRSDLDNPGTCAVGIINAINQQFIDAGVKFVVQVGDLVNNESWTHPSTGQSERTLPYRAQAAQWLYDAGIGFMPIRGNHEGSSTAANELPVLFPQTLGEGDHLYGVDRIIDSSVDSLRGLSYGFDLGNVRIVLIDQFTRKDGSGSTNDNALDQVGWVDRVLEERGSDTHAFVMSHKNLIGQNHADCLFGGNSLANTDARNEFIASMQANKVSMYLGGHDHMHHRSVIASPDGTASVEQMICSSNSYKFYTPKRSPNDLGGCETVIAQELYTIGYYVFTVDGPCVTVEYYACSHGADYGSISMSYPPVNFDFYLRERFGFSLNGQKFAIANGEPFTIVRDTYKGTSARILSGTNADTETDSGYSGRDMSKLVQTGWKDMPAETASAVFKLWGMSDNLSLWDSALTGELPDRDNAAPADTFVLSLSYEAALVRPSALRRGSFCLQAKDADGNWVKAVHLNDGGTPKFVYGPWPSNAPLGTYGVDPSTHTVWAVLNRDGEFAAC